MIFKKRKPQDRQSSFSETQKVFSYYTANRNKIDNIERQSYLNDSLQDRRSRPLKSLLFFTFVAILIFVSLIYLSLLGTKAHIQIAGDEYRNNSSYQGLISKSLSSSFKNRTKILLDSKEIERSILNNVPEASSVSVGSSLLGHMPEVKIYTASALAVFTQGSDSFIISNHGKILISTKDTTYNYLNLPQLKNNTGFGASIGMQFIRPAEAIEINSLISQLKQDSVSFSLAIDKVPHQLDLYETGKGYYIKFLLDDNSILEQYGAMKATENKLSSSSIQPNEYIDVRLADKVFYK